MKRKDDVIVCNLRMDVSAWSFEYKLSPCFNECDDDYCSHKINNSRITSVPIERIFNDLRCAIQKKGKLPDIDNYCLARLFNANKLYQCDKYKLFTTSGYYGAGLDIMADFETWQTFVLDVGRMLALSDNDKIRMVLTREYGYLLEELQNANFEIRKIKYIDILPPIDFRRTDGITHDFGDDMPIGIYKKIGDKYRIIDGHHRWKNASGRKSVSIIVVN